jgi:(1->4)-alpha-D-glucan 1-alpha-D-glucosylmutase
VSTPVATYRLQLHTEFTFDDARAVVGYLADLGVSHLYLSPVVAAAKGSRHGYDVVDPTQVNPELGGRARLEALATEA